MVQESLEALLWRMVARVSDDEPPDLTPDMHLMDDVGLDSFALLLLHTEIEDEVGVPLPPLDVEPTAANVCALIAEALRGASPTDHRRTVAPPVEPIVIDHGAGGSL